MRDAKSEAYLVNTGWNGQGKRISLDETRAIIDAILNSEVNLSNSNTLPIFNLQMPVSVKNVSLKTLDPRNSWKNEKLWESKAKELASLFIKNFEQFCDSLEGRNLVKHGPII